MERIQDLTNEELLAQAHVASLATPAQTILDAIQAGQAFSATTGRINYVDGNDKPAWYVYNPKNSGKNMNVYSIAEGSNTNSDMLYLWMFTNLPSVDTWNPFFSVANRKADATDKSAAQCRYTNKMANPPSGVNPSNGVSQQLGMVLIDMSGTYTTRLPNEVLQNGDVIVLPPGYGILMNDLSYDQLYSTVQWFETAV